MDKSSSKAIKIIESKAKKGNIRAAYQLALYYRDGNYVDKDESISERYMSAVLTGLKTSSFRIDNIFLGNLKQFEDFTIDFKASAKGRKSNVIVLVGVNGSGKTTILEAISKSLSWISNGIVSPHGSGQSIDRHDIRNSSLLDYASITSSFSLSKNQLFKSELLKYKKGVVQATKSDLKDVRELAALFREAEKNEPNTAFPLMAYYSVKRGVEVMRSDISSLTKSSNTDSPLSKFNGYHNSLNGSADFKLFYHWFKYISDTLNASMSASGKLINEREAQLKEALRLLESNEQDTAKLIAELKDTFQVAPQADGIDITKYQYLVETINAAITKFIPYFTDMKIVYTPEVDLVVSKNGEQLSILQLSQGEKSLIALVSDIARRLFLLNSSADKPLEGSGVVLIDEIDQHIHPSWQQKIVRNLEETFPNIQFIISTHSPQVLSTVHKDSIRLIGRDENGSYRSFKAIADSYGHPSNDVMQSIMHVDPQPDIPELTELKNLTQVVENDEISLDEAKEKLDCLYGLLGRSHPQLIRIEMVLKRREFLKS